MKLTRLRLSNFQCFGEAPTEVTFEPTTFLIGPNGSGKTAILQALARLFGFDQNLRRVLRSDFHVPTDIQGTGKEEPADRLWIEADFEFEELLDGTKKHSTIPSNFSHMRLEVADAVPIMRIRLEASRDVDDLIEEKLHYVLERDSSGKPTKQAEVHPHDRNAIRVHYLPARRDPGDHISYSAGALLGRVLRAASWSNEAGNITTFTQEISITLGKNAAVIEVGTRLSTVWSSLHKGTYYSNPRISFERSDIDGLLRHLTVAFAPAHGAAAVDFTRLGDGQKSLLYITVVLGVQELGRQVLAGKLKDWDVQKLRPAYFTLIAVEEPENSLSPHYLGRVLKELTAFADNHDAQSVIATHAPPLLKRVPPERIRYLRLTEQRVASVRRISMPPDSNDAHKFVREAVLAYPELYFSRLVILGEGDSEEIVIPRLLQAKGFAEDVASVVVVPLGGRHVNHFWRLLQALEIPFVTLLDLDSGRFQGGWARIRYAIKQLRECSPSGNSPFSAGDLDSLPKADDSSFVAGSQSGATLLARLEAAGVFFSSPLDLDFAMLSSFGDAYQVNDDELEIPDDKLLTSVLGSKRSGAADYNEDQKKLFKAYQSRFKRGSKPVAHLEALSRLEDSALATDAPQSLLRLLDRVESELKKIPE